MITTDLELEALPTLTLQHIRLLKQMRCSKEETVSVSSDSTFELAKAVNDLLIMALVEPLEGGLWMAGGMVYGTARLLPAGHMAIKRRERVK